MESTEENKENPPCKESQVVDEKLMKPFSLGWTREVVRRVILKNGQPACDIYYFSPSGKKIRSLTEAKSNLTDGLSPECFSFKREPLGLDSKFETVRNAKHKKKDDKPSEKTKSRRGLKRGAKLEKSEEKDKENETETEPKKRKTDEEEADSKPNSLEEKPTEAVKSLREKVQVKKNSPNKPKAGKSPSKRRSFITKKKTKTKTLAKLPLAKKRKEILKRMVSPKQAKQSKILASKKILKKAVKKVASKSKKANNKEIAINNKKSRVMSKRSQKTVKSSAKTKSETVAEDEKSENETKAGSPDLKSIVQKNIGKYREMREKQKLGVAKAAIKKPSKPSLGLVNNSRLESFLKNRSNYLKPLEKGWRRELVYRANCAKAGHQADVYYYHPSGKKFRSSREISDNLKMISGLSLDFFTFRKEAIGCGEPQEVIRNARSHQKN